MVAIVSVVVLRRKIVVKDCLVVKIAAFVSWQHSLQLSDCDGLERTQVLEIGKHSVKNRLEPILLPFGLVADKRDQR